MYMNKCMHSTALRTLHKKIIVLLQILSVRPEGEVTLKEGGGRCVVELLFSPEQRMPPFTEELQLECLGAVHPLLVMKGCCQGVEVRLDSDYLQFGAVVQRCQATRRIIMQNTGDIGARYTSQDLKLQWLLASKMCGWFSKWMNLSENAITWTQTEICICVLASSAFPCSVQIQMGCKKFCSRFHHFPCWGLHHSRNGSIPWSDLCPYRDKSRSALWWSLLFYRGG